MESKNEQISLMECMSLSRMTELPKEWDGKRIWLKAIVKVSKCDNSKNYALAENNGRNKPSIMRDFGNMARIVSIDAIYPTYYMSENQKPDLRNKTDIITYLGNAGFNKENVEFMLGTVGKNGEDKTDEEKKADKETVKMWVNEVSIKLQLDVLNDKSRK